MEDLMEETALWGHLRPELQRFGKFQKISDRFTPGVPDLLGCCRSLKRPLGAPIALELKEFSGVRILKVKFRPRQLDWLREWEEAGGRAYILSSHKRTVMLHHHGYGEELEEGASPDRVQDLARMVFFLGKDGGWRDLATVLVNNHLLSS